MRIADSLRGLIHFICKKCIYQPPLMAVVLVLGASALANTGDDANENPYNAWYSNGWDECDCSCWPNSLIGEEGETGAPRNAGHYVSLGRGAVIEAETDYRLPGPTLSSTAKRTYSSMAGAEEDSDLSPVWLNGNKWSHRMITRYLVVVSSDGSGPTEIDLYLDAGSKLRYTRRSGSTTVYDGPDDHYTKLIHIPYDSNDPDNTGVYEHFNEQTGEIWAYHDFSVASTAARGLMARRTSQYRPTTEHIYFTFCGTVEEANRLSEITTSQGWEVDYVYRYDSDPSQQPTDGMIERVDIKNADDKVIQRIKYTYMGDPGLTVHADVGGPAEDGDLLMTEVLTFGTNDTLSTNPADTALTGYRVWLYRYDAASRIKWVFEPDQVERMIEEVLGDAETDRDAVDLLNEADTVVDDYISRAYEYYTADVDTGDIATPWEPTGEDLETLYGVEERAETEVAGKVGEANRETLYRVKTFTNYTGEGGVKRSYFYTQLNSTSPTGDANEARWVTIEDTEDSSGDERYRKIYVMNEKGVLLREVFVDDPSATTPVYWCGSYKLGEEGYMLNRPVEVRLPSAHTEVNCTTVPITLTSLRKFLNPTVGSNDSDTINASTGRIFVTEYDETDYETFDGTYTLTSGVKQGRTGDTHYLGYQKFQKYDGTPGNNSEYGRYWLVESYLERDFGQTKKPLPQSETVSNGTTQFKPQADDVTTIDYTFSDTATQQKVVARTTTLPAAEEAENGSDERPVIKEYFDGLGRLRWLKDAEDNVHYTSYDKKMGTVAYTHIDVNTGALDADITATTNTWEAWTTGVPSGFTSGNSVFQEIETKTTVDDLSRPRQIEDAEGVVTAIAYNGNQTRVYGAWNSADELPILVTNTDDMGRVLERYALDAGGVTPGTSGGLPTGVDAGETQSDCVAWTTMQYNEFFQLEQVNRYHTIPATGGQDPGTDAGTYYYPDLLEYDNEGRLRYTIKHVSGADTDAATEQVTRVDYDRLSRPVALYTGVSGTGHDVATASLDTGLVQVASMYYDQSTPGSGTSGVGDSLLTSRKAYNKVSGGSTDTDYYTELRYHRNWRAQLRGLVRAGKAGSTDTETAVGPYAALLPDNLGRAIGSAVFQDGNEPTWAESRTTWEARFATGAASTGRRALTRHAYDLLSQRYETNAYNIQASNGAVLGRVESDFYHDLNGQLVAASSTAGGAVEIAYDGALRAYQQRVVTTLHGDEGSNDHYNSGAFNYRAPVPQPGVPTAGTLPYSGGVGGDDKVLTIGHSVYDKLGNTLQSIYLESDQGDTTSVGLDLANHDDFVQSATHFFYDEAKRLEKRVAYGTGADTYTYAGLPTWDAGSIPSSSDTVLVTTFGYDEASRLESTTDAKGVVYQNSYDDLNRPVYSVANVKNFSFTNGTGTGTPGSGENEDEDQAIKRTYNGLNQVLTLTALDRDGDGSGTTDDQTTTFSYGDAVLAHVLNKIQMPDSPGGGGTDVVSFTYHMDGRLKKRTDQRGVEISYDYDRVLRLLVQQVVDIGDSSVDDAVQAISYTRDNMSRVNRVTSHDDVVTLTGSYHEVDVVNQVLYEYHDHHALKKERQDHDSKVDTAGGLATLDVEYAFDAFQTTSGGVYDYALRPAYTVYPNGMQLHTTYGSSGSIDDLLSRAAGLADENTSTANTPGDAIATYTWMGGGTLAKKVLDVPEIELNRIAPDGSAPAAGLEGLDRFGRVAAQAWIDTSGTSDEDRIHTEYGYDQVHRMLYADRLTNPGLSQAFEIDGLHRVNGFSIGVLERDGNGDVELTGTPERAATDPLYNLISENHDLDLLNNAVAIEDDSTTNKVTQSINKANEVEDGTSDEDRVTDASEGKKLNGPNFSQSTDADGLERVFSTAASDVEHDQANDVLTLKNGDVSKRAVLVSAERGAMSPGILLQYTGGGTATGKAGLIFGYQDASNYWLYLIDFDASPSVNAELIQVSGGSANPIHTHATTSLGGGLYFLTAGGIPGGLFDHDRSPVDLGTFPAGRWGLYSETSEVDFYFSYTADEQFPVPLSSSWSAGSNNVMVIPNHRDDKDEDGALELTGGWQAATLPTLLEGVRADTFQVTFKTTRQLGDLYGKAYLVMGHQGSGDYAMLSFVHDNDVGMQALEVVDGVAQAITPGSVATPPVAGDDKAVWYRVICDGTDVKVYAIVKAIDASAPTSGDWSSATKYWDTTSATQFSFTASGGGQIGFLGGVNTMYVDDLVVQTDHDGDSNWTTEHDEHFSINGSGQIEENLEYDAAGNLTFDGRFQYTYDAWNRLVKAEKAYRDPGTGTVTVGDEDSNAATPDVATVTYAYDGQHRRIQRHAQNTGQLDQDLHYYWAGSRIIEERLVASGSTTQKVAKQYVWGLTYIDELICVGLSHTLAGDSTKVSRRYYALTDHQFSVLGLVDKDGYWIERNEYGLYGQRQVYSQKSRGFELKLLSDTDGDGDADDGDYGTMLANYTGPLSAGVGNKTFDQGDTDGDGDIDDADTGRHFAEQTSALSLKVTNDPELQTPTRGVAAFRDPTDQVALNTIGFQGLMEDEVTGNKYQRTREFSGMLGRFLQRDKHAAIYPDGMNSYAAYHVFGQGTDATGMLWKEYVGLVRQGLTGESPSQYAARKEQERRELERKKRKKKVCDVRGRMGELIDSTENLSSNRPGQRPQPTDGGNAMRRAAHNSATIRGEVRNTVINGGIGLAESAVPSPQDTLTGGKGLYTAATADGLSPSERRQLAAGSAILCFFGMMDIVDFVPDPTDGAQKAVRNGVEAGIEGTKWTPHPGFQRPSAKMGRFVGDEGNSTFAVSDEAAAAMGVPRGSLVPWNEGIPDFSGFAVSGPSNLPSCFNVSGLTGAHGSDRTLILQYMASKTGMSQRSIKRWLSTNDVRLHHAGGEAVQLVPGPIHNLHHSGGAQGLRGN
jgi:hypothetical protein